MVGPVSFVRTVLGDIDPSELGVTYAHEHLVIDGGRPVALEPDFDLSDVDRMTTEVRAAAALGLRRRGRRDALRRRPQRRQAGRALAADGRPRRRPDRPPPRPLLRAGPLEPPGPAPRTSPTCSSLDITEGIDELDYSGPVVRRTDHRAGVIKVAGSDGGPSPRDRRVFEAAAEAHRRTGAPILTHCEAGTGALEQVQALRDCGGSTRRTSCSATSTRSSTAATTASCARPARSSSTTSRSAGATGRTGRSSCSGGSPRTGCSTPVVLGMDAARQGYYSVYGGAPGLGWLLDGFSAEHGGVRAR